MTEINTSTKSDSSNPQVKFGWLKLVALVLLSILAAYGITWFTYWIIGEPMPSR